MNITMNGDVMGLKTLMLNDKEISIITVLLELGKDTYPSTRYAAEMALASIKEQTY